MRHIRIALLNLRFLRGLAAILACLVALAGCRFGDAVSFFDEDSAIEQAIGTLRARMGAQVRVLNLAISPDQIVVRVQAPSDRERVDEWRVERVRIAAINWERVSGPSRHQPTLINPDLDTNLFDLNEVDFVFAVQLARAAVERAGLADKAKVTRMELAREAFVVPAPASGTVRWTIDVSSARETVQVFADTAGMFAGMNVDGTLRARNLNLFQQLDLVAEAAHAFRFIYGPDRMLTRVSVGARNVGFETNLPESSAAATASGNTGARKVYTWNLNGLQRVLGAVNEVAAISQKGETFGADEVDWAALPKIAAAAKEQLGMPQGRISGIGVSRPSNPLGPSVVLWKIEVTDQNKENGFILADATGWVKQVMLPESRRKAVDWRDPKTVIDTIARLGVDFGQDRQYAEIVFLEDKVLITAQDHMEPNISRDFLLNDIGYERGGTPVLLAGDKPPFRIGEVSGLTADRVRDLQAQTLAALKMPPKSISGITIRRASMEPPRNGRMTIEIRADDKSFGRAGRVNYELDGTVIKTYPP